MRLDLTSFAFGSSLQRGTGTASWGTSVGQSGPEYYFTKVGCNQVIAGILYCSVEKEHVSIALGRGGAVVNAANDDSILLTALFRKVYVNGIKIPYPFILCFLREHSESHEGRCSIKYSGKTYFNNGTESFSNEVFLRVMSKTLGLADSACWFCYDISVAHNDTLHLRVIIIDKDNSVQYVDSDSRKRDWENRVEIDSKQEAKEDEIATYLQNAYNNAATGFQVSAIHITGIKYGKDIKERRISVDRIVRKAGLNPSYTTELTKGVKIYENIATNRQDFDNLPFSPTEMANGKFTPQFPHHLIYYGAPGTAKSTSIKERTKGKEVHRVTFHPDTDYAAFVGCYKPTQVEGTGEITYKFVAQAFVNAYVSAWKKLYDGAEEQKDVFLIIEEINRGNCAQIFGDLFQALDRNTEGYSEYPIEPDQDLARYLCEAFEDSGIEVASIKNGSALLLPPNLFIWATMNTSDQSLFPIDSAFKRRWGWKYLPIRNDHKGHVIGLQDGRRYDWWEFLEAVNSRIEKVTESEDKQLGYWFAKPDYDTIVSADTMVGKVVFYLWNDVFKDYFRDVNSPFTIKEDGEKKRVLKFREFYDEEGNVREDVLALFIEGMKLSPLPVPSEPDPEPSPATETEEDVPPEVREDETPSDAPAIETVTAPIPTLTTTPAYEEEEEEETTDPTAFFNS